MNDSNLISIAAAPPESMAFVSMSMAESISIMLENAVNAEKNAQIVQTAAVAQCCALMISVGAAGAAK
ncbi:RebB family R body protein [Sessilibacter corallicola]|uniref:Killing trait domain-containing protein n=1 Tax=Sessilibacter corallicola TaxID=2904075 RepID=A0ABQ0A5G1_9GAMM|nr:RebB family R body protein [Sessilibacter corallicola]MCE2027663.1 RebB family R body protein [Sessilibacter corallicola]